MSFWKFIGGFVLFNAVCDMFSSKPKRTNDSPQQRYHNYNHDECGYIKDEHGDMRDKLYDFEFDRHLYDDDHDW